MTSTLSFELTRPDVRSRLRRQLQLVDWGGLAASAALVLTFAAAFTTLHLAHGRQQAIPRTGTVASYTSHDYEVPCGTVGGKPGGTGGASIYCEQTD